MKEIWDLFRGATGATRLEKWLAGITIILSLYVFPYTAMASVVIIVLLFLYIWITSGLVWVFWTVVAVYLFLIFGSKGFNYLASNRDLSVFTNRPWLYSLATGGNWLMAWVRKIHYLLFVEAKKLIALKKQLVVWSAKKFWALPLKIKLIVTVSAVLITIPAVFLISLKTVETVQSKWPYGVNRNEMTLEELAVRKDNRVNHALWAVWGKPNAIENAKCMEQYKELIRAEASKYGITPERVEALLYVEGSCKTDQINKNSGAAGFAQIMLDVACEEKLITDKAFCSLVRKQRLTVIPKNRKIEDGRLDPKQAITVAVKILGEGKQYWGDENWAFVQYHMGQGNLRILSVYYLDEMFPGWDKEFPIDRTILPGKSQIMRIQVSDPTRSVPKALAKYKVTYDDIFFRCTPKKTPKTYTKLYRMSDDSATYVYTGLAALKGFNLMRTDYPVFEAMVKAQQDPDGGLSNRPMRAWFSDVEAKYKNLADIQTATLRGELVRVPNDPTYGFVLRTEGGSRIGQCDPGNEANYYVTRKATLGMIYFIASKTKELGADPWEVTGLIRSHWMYDGKNCLPPTQPRTHVIGSAFDIGFYINGKPKSEATKRALIFVIRDLRADGLIDRIDEDKADHIVYNPEFEQFFEGIYNDVMSGGSPLIVK